MNRTIVFFFKGRHGFGHVRRTLLVADEVRVLDPTVEIFLVGQVRSLLPLRGTAHHVINLPHLHRLPDDVTEAMLRELLDRLVAEIAPALLVEDTFPDPNHLFLPAFRERRKVLLARPLSGVFLDRFRHGGLLRHYDRILLAQDAAAFARAGHSPDSLLVGEFSPRFTFVGPVFHVPSVAEVAAVAVRYAGRPLVVAAAGAGGESTTEGFIETFFRAMAEVAARAAARHEDAAFVFVTGPYHAGWTPVTTGNVTVLEYEPQLAALLAVAKVAVIRPGFNSLHEAQAGPARLVLVPGTNTAEDQQREAHRLAAVDGVDVSTVNDVDRLDALVCAGLRAAPRVPAGPRPAQREVARVLLAELDAALRPAPAPAGRVFLLLDGLDSPGRGSVARAVLPGVPHVGTEVGRYSQGIARLVLLDVAPDLGTTPAALRARGVRAVLVPEGDPPDDQAAAQPADWLRTQPASGQGVLVTGLYRLTATGTDHAEVAYRLGRLRDEQVTPGLYLDLTAVDEVDLPGYLAGLRDWLVAGRIEICGPAEFAGLRLGAVY